MAVKKTKTSKVAVDNVSRLPADILYFILSLLTVKEAARTSILSQRWRNLWKTSATSSLTLGLDILVKDSSCLNSGFGDCLDGNLFDCESGNLLRSKRGRFVGFIHQILHLDHGCVRDSFRLRFCLNFDVAHLVEQWRDMAMTQFRDFVNNIDPWIEMATDKRSPKVVMGSSHFVIQREIYRAGDLFYSIPCLRFSQKMGSAVECMGLKRCSPMSLDSNGFRFRSLLDLRLDHARTDDDNIVGILSNCPDLEKLWLSRCKGLLNLRIYGSSLKLKFLTILFCFGLKKIELFAQSLIRLQYSGECVEFIFVYAPQLSNFIYRTEREDSSGSLSYACGKLSSDFPHLESLMLSVVPEEVKNPEPVQPFINLKKLVLLVKLCTIELWGLILLLQASPSLRSLELHLNDFEFLHDGGELEGIIEKPLDFPHFSIEEIMLSGFKARPHEMEFVKHLLKNATGLKKIIFVHKCLHYQVPSGTLDGKSEKELEGAQVAVCKCKKIEGVSEWLGNLTCGHPGVKLLFA